MAPRAWLGSLSVVGLLALAPASAPAETCGEEAACGKPACWEPTVRARPDMPRVLRVSCRNATSARLISQPAHGTVSDVSTDWYGLHFKLRADADAPEQDKAVFEVRGQEGSVELAVRIQIVPLSVNSPPTCWAGRVSQRSDGTERVYVSVPAHCEDPDGDEFTMHGGGPGTHPESPKKVPAGENESNWSYRTATHSGTETTSIWAVDVLGARSGDAKVEVEVGTSIDRLPTCMPNPMISSPDGVYPIYSRPGATRRFGILCEDADADRFDMRLTHPPSRGTIALFAVGQEVFGYRGAERWVDGTYSPEDAGLEPDEFAITAHSEAGEGPSNRMAIVPRALPENGGNGCGYGPVAVKPDTSGRIRIMCTDAEGDPLAAEVIEGPLHGTVGPAAIATKRFGQAEILIPYRPPQGYQGYDCVKVAVTDGHGGQIEMTVDIWVDPAREPSDGVPPEEDLTVTPVPVAPPPEEPPYSLPPMRRLARAALGTRNVERVKAGRVADVWAPRRLSRRRLLRRRRAPALFFACRVRCLISSESRLHGASRGRQRARRSALSALPNSANVVWLGVAREDARALRSTRSTTAAFTLRVRRAGGKRHVVRHTIRVDR